MSVKPAGPFVVLRSEGQSFRTPYGDVMDFIAGDAETDGSFSLHERVAPPGSRSTPHVHQRLIEAFYVVEGELEFVVGGEEIHAGPGTFVMARRGVEHAWRNAAERDARALVLFSPSAERAYFEELDALTRAAAGARVDAEKLRELAERYGWT